MGKIAVIYWKRGENSEEAPGNILELKTKQQSLFSKTWKKGKKVIKFASIDENLPENHANLGNIFFSMKSEQVNVWKSIDTMDMMWVIIGYYDKTIQT